MVKTNKWNLEWFLHVVGGEAEATAVFAKYYSFFYLLVAQLQISRSKLLYSSRYIERDF